MTKEIESTLAAVAIVTLIVIALDVVATAESVATAVMNPLQAFKTALSNFGSSLGAAINVPPPQGVFVDQSGDLPGGEM